MAFNEDSSLPPLPTINVDKLARTAQDLRELFEVRIGQVVTHEMGLRWARDVSVLLDLPSKSVNNLVETFRQYVDTKVDRPFVSLLADQLAARERELTTGPLIGFVQPTKREWVPVEVLNVTSDVWRDDKPASLFVMRALGGHPAGHILTRKFPNTWLNFLAYRVGFSRRIQYDFESRHFIGLRFWGFVVPQEGSTEIVFEDLNISPSFKKANQRIIKLRTRFDYEAAECPNDFQHTCFECTIEKSQCPAATTYNSPPDSKCRPTKSTSVTSAGSTG